MTGRECSGVGPSVRRSRSAAIANAATPRKLSVGHIPSDRPRSNPPSAPWIVDARGFPLADEDGTPASTTLFSMAPQELSLHSINIFGGTQARVQMTDEAVESYADEMTQGTDFPRSTSILTALPTGWPTVFTATSPPNATNSRRSLRPSNLAAARTPCVTPSAQTPPTASTAPTPPKSPSTNGPTRPTPYSPSYAVYPSISFAAAATKWPRPASSTSWRP